MPMSFGQVIWPGGTAGRAHSSVASCRTVAGSLTVNPVGSTSRTCRLGGRGDCMNVILVSFGTARHSAVSLADPAPIMTPPGFTLGEGWMAAPTAGACDAEPDAAVPATVVPQAASPIMSPAVMPPSAARLAAPSGLPSALIATPFRPAALSRRRPAAPPATAPRRAGSAGPAWPPGAGPAVSGRAGPGAPTPAVRCWCGPAWLPQTHPHILGRATAPSGSVRPGSPSTDHGGGRVSAGYPTITK